MTNPSLVLSTDTLLSTGLVANQGNILVAGNTSLVNTSPSTASNFVSVIPVRKTLASPLTTNSITVQNSNSPVLYVGLTPAGTIAALTIVFPTAPNESQVLKIVSSHIVTALTNTIPAGTTIATPVTALAVNTPVTYVYDLASKTWLTY